MPRFSVLLSSSRAKVLFGVTALGALLSADRVSASSFSNFQKATMVIGQADFTTQKRDMTQSTTIGAVDVALSSKGVLAVAQSEGRVVLFNTLPTTNGTPADVVVGQPDFTSTGNTQEPRGTVIFRCSASVMGECYGVTFSPDGNKLIVADTVNNRVLIWNSIPTHNGQAADVVIGQPYFTSHQPDTAATGFDMPVGVTVTPKGQLLVCDYRGGRVLLYNSIPQRNGVAADVVIGQKDLTSGNEYMGFRNGLAASYLRSPSHAALAPDGKLLVCSSGNDAVHIWNSLPTTNGAPADVVIGQSDFSSFSYGIPWDITSASRLSTPWGVAVSATGQLAISNNRRVLIYNRIPSQNGASADAVLGQRDFTTLASDVPSAQLIGGAHGLTFLPDGRLVVSTNRVLFFGDIATENDSKVKTAQPR